MTQWCSRLFSRACSGTRACERSGKRSGPGHNSGGVGLGKGGGAEWSMERNNAEQVRKWSGERTKSAAPADILLTSLKFISPIQTLKSHPYDEPIQQ